MRYRVRTRTARRRISATAAIGTVLATFAVPAVASAAANPLTFNYSNSTDILDYAHPTGAVVVGRGFKNPALVDKIQNGGGEVYQYVNVVEAYWVDQTASGDQAALYGGAKNNPDFLMKPTRFNWPELPMTDMRPGSPWVLHAVQHIRTWFPTTHAKGIFLDVIGDRLWTSAWDSMSSSEQAAWTAGSKDFVARLRAALGPNVLIVANNIWEKGNPNLNGIVIEHHPVSNQARWVTMTGRSDWTKPVRNMVIANSTGEVSGWAKVAGVTHISAQSSYGSPADPLLPFSPLPGVSGLVSGTAPPAPAPAATPRRAATAVVLKGNLLTNPSFEKLLNPWTSWRGSLRRRAATGAPQGKQVAQITYKGPGARYAVTRPAAKGASATAGARYTARAWVRAGSKNTAGKPITFVLRERTRTGGLVQEVKGRTVTLTKAFRPVNGTLTAQGTGNRLEVSLIQDRARTGNSFQFDAISLARLR